jgi:hypothetical protein
MSGNLNAATVERIVVIPGLSGIGIFTVDNNL